MPDVGVPVLPAGVPGETGPTGLPGAFWAEAPANSYVYGRAPGQWVPVLPLSGTASYGPAGTMNGGLSFGADVAISISNMSRHLSTQVGMGFNVTGSTLGYVSSSGGHYWYINGAQALRITQQARLNFPYGQFLQGSSFSEILGMYTGQGTIQVNYSINGNLISYAGAGWYLTGELQVADVGIRPQQNTQTNGISWRWDGNINVRVDQAVEYPVANACDERLKQDIAPCTFDALAALRKVRLYQYRWREHRVPGKFERPHRAGAPLQSVGFVAQRLAEDFPQAARVGGKARGAEVMGTADRNTMLAALCRATQQLDERVQALRR